MTLARSGDHLRLRRLAIVAAVGCFLLGYAISPATAEQARLYIVPAPKKCELQGGTLVLTPKSRLVATQTDLKPLAEVLAEEIARLVGMRLAVTCESPAPADIVVKIDPLFRNEAYAVDIDTMATVRAGNVPALAMGTVTLLQALTKSDSGVDLPHMTVRDEPAVAYRGLMVDCARSWHSPDTLKQMVVLCRWYKVRYLHLHLTDDQSFTFPSRAYPAISARCPHYTIEQLRDLEAFAKVRGVVLIPELEIPGHATMLVQALPKLFGTNPAPVGDWRTTMFQAICAGREETYQALDTLVAEMCDVFRESPYFHIGADEVDYRFWNKCADTRAYMATHGIENMDELYRHFIVRMNTSVKKHGKKMIVWEGFAKEGKTEIPRDITVMVFECKYNLPPDLLAGGYKVINAAWQPLYITPGRRWSPEHIYGWNHYRWESCWDTSAAFKQPIVVPPTPDVIGAQICAWEQGEGAELPSLRDRTPAMSERIWNPNAGRSFADFSRRFKATDLGLERLLKQE